MWLAGGGVKKGYVYGATDEFGFAAAENPIHVHDLHATLLSLILRVGASKRYPTVDFYALVDFVKKIFAPGVERK